MDTKRYADMDIEELKATGGSFWSKPIASMTPDESFQASTIIIRMGIVSHDGIDKDGKDFSGCQTIAAGYEVKQLSDRHYSAAMKAGII